MKFHLCLAVFSLAGIVSCKSSQHQASEVSNVDIPMETLNKPSCLLEGKGFIKYICDIDNWSDTSTAFDIRLWFGSVDGIDEQLVNRLPYEFRIQKHNSVWVAFVDDRDDKPVYNEIGKYVGQSSSFKETINGLRNLIASGWKFPGSVVTQAQGADGRDRIIYDVPVVDFGISKGVTPIDLDDQWNKLRILDEN